MAKYNVFLLRIVYNVVEKLLSSRPPSYSIEPGGRSMQKNAMTNRPSSGAKAIAIDPTVMLARYRLILMITLILSAAFALGLRIIFGF
jgi:hypothetical protein